jgi:hypothetical protein
VGSAGIDVVPTWDRLLSGPHRYHPRRGHYVSLNAKRDGDPPSRAAETTTGIHFDLPSVVVDHDCVASKEAPAKDSGERAALGPRDGREVKSGDTLRRQEGDRPASRIHQPEVHSVDVAHCESGFTTAGTSLCANNRPSELQSGC